MLRILRTVLAADDPRVQKAANDYVAKVRTVAEDDELDARTMKLINMYAQDLIIDKGTPIKQIIRQNGPELIEFLSRKTDVDYDDIPKILNYFAKQNFKLVASKQINASEDGLQEWYRRHKGKYIHPDVWAKYYNAPIMHDEDEWGGQYKTYGEMWEAEGYTCPACEQECIDSIRGWE